MTFLSRVPAIMASLAILAGAAAIALDPSEARRKRGELVLLERRAVEDPALALFAAAELSRSGGAFYEELFAGGRSSGPAIEAAAIGAERRARSAAVRFILRAAHGLPLSGSKPIAEAASRARAAGEKVASAREIYEQRLRLFAKAAGLAELPRGLAPTYAEAFAPEVGPDGKVAKPAFIDASALGFGLLTEVRLAARLLSVRRKTAGGLAVLGATPTEGFEGLVLLQCAAAKIEALRSNFAYDGKVFGPVPGADYDPFAEPRYYPHAIAILDSGESGTAALECLDPKSRLLDQAALLSGACEFARLFAPPRTSRDRAPAEPPLVAALKAFDVREDVFPPTLWTTAKEVARFVFRNLAALHFDPSPERLSFASEATPRSRGDSVRLEEIALAIGALEGTIEAFADDPRLKAEARKLLVSQAQFLLERQRPDGELSAHFDLAGKKEAVKAGIAAEFLAIGGLLAASRVTEEERYLQAAAKLARSVDRRRFDPWVSLYLDESPSAELALTPLDAAAVLGALRDLVHGGVAEEALSRFRDTYHALAGAGVLPGEEGECAIVRVRVARP